MNNLEARIILEKLFEGVHPETGELFAEDHVCNEAQGLRALHRAIVALNSQPVAAEPAKKARQSHENSKKAWAQEEDAYLRNACRQEIPLDEISSVVNLSPSYFSKYFKNVTQVSFSEYLANLRLENAIQDMLTKNSTVSAAAIENGFANVKSFITQCKKVYDCTPAQYKKKLLNR